MSWFFIYSKKAGEYIGTAKLDKINTESMTAEDGIMIGERRFKGKGYGYQTYDLILNMIREFKTQEGCRWLQYK